MMTPFHYRTSNWIIQYIFCSVIFPVDSGSVGIGEPPGGRGEVGVTLTLTKEVMQEIFLGKSTAFDCYMNGTLHVDGSLSQAKLLKLVLDRVSSSVTQP